MVGKIHRWPGDNRRAPLLCLHGFLGNGSDFDILADHLTDRPAMIAPDFPDYRGIPVKVTDPWRAVLVQLDRIISDECKDRKPILLGYSMGGRIALQYAVKHSTRIRGLVLVGATPGLENKDDRNARKHADAKRATTLATLSMKSFLENWFAQPLLKTQKRIAEPHHSRMRQYRMKNNPEAIAYYLTVLGTGGMQPVWDRLKEINIPTLLITGKEDSKFEAIARRMLGLLPKARHAVVPNAGHAACFENPRGFSSELTSFVRSIPNL